MVKCFIKQNIKPLLNIELFPSNYIKNEQNISKASSEENRIKKLKLENKNKINSQTKYDELNFVGKTEKSFNNKKDDFSKGIKSNESSLTNFEFDEFKSEENINKYSESHNIKIKEDINIDLFKCVKDQETKYNENMKIFNACSIQTNSKRIEKPQSRDLEPKPDVIKHENLSLYDKKNESSNTIFDFTSIRNDENYFDEESIQANKILLAKKLKYVAYKNSQNQTLEDSNENPLPDKPVKKIKFDYNSNANKFTKTETISVKTNAKKCEHNNTSNKINYRSACVSAQTEDDDITVINSFSLKDKNPESLNMSMLEGLNSDTHKDQSVNCSVDMEDGITMLSGSFIKSFSSERGNSGNGNDIFFDEDITITKIINKKK